MISQTSNMPLKYPPNSKNYQSKPSPQYYVSQQPKILNQASRLQKQNVMNQSSQQRYIGGSAYSNNEQLRHSINDLMKEMESALESPQMTEQENFYFKRQKVSQGYLRKSKKSELIVEKNEERLYEGRQNVGDTDSDKGFGMMKMKTLPQLQISIVQHILMLREEKINILEERNQIIDRKNELQREVAKIRKKNIKAQNKQPNDSLKQSPNNASSKQSPATVKSANSNYLEQLQIKNNNLKAQIHRLLSSNQDSIPVGFSFDEIRLQDTKTMLEIQKYSRLSSRIQQQINLQTNSDMNRFETFLPSQKRMHLESVSEHSSKGTDLRMWNNPTVNALSLESQKLIKQANEVIKQKNQSGEKLSLKVLEIIGEVNEKIRDGFVQRVKRQKHYIPLIKYHHQQLRSILDK